MQGGGLYITGGSLALTSCTFTGNRALVSMDIACMLKRVEAHVIAEGGRLH